MAQCRSEVIVIEDLRPNGKYHVFEESQEILGAEMRRREGGVAAVDMWMAKRDKVTYDDAFFVAGSKAFMAEAFRQLGCEMPHISSYPSDLGPFYHREIRKMTLDEALKGSDLKSGVFIKHNAPVPHFRGLAVHGKTDPGFNRCKRSSSVFRSPLVAWTSIYRCYVLNGRVAQVVRVAGDICSVDFEVSVKPMLIAMSGGVSDPCGYALDVGIDAGGRVSVVSFKDGYSLPVVSKLDPGIYFDIIKARWDQIVSASRR